MKRCHRWRSLLPKNRKEKVKSEPVFVAKSGDEGKCLKVIPRPEFNPEIVLFLPKFGVFPSNQKKSLQS